MKDSKSNKPNRVKDSSEYQRFEKLAKALIAVPKSVIDKRQLQYEKNKKGAKKRKVA